MVLYLELVLGDLKKNLELNVHAVPIHMLSFTYCTNAQAVQMQPLYNSHSVLRHTLYCRTCDQYTRYTNPHGEMTHTMYHSTLYQYTNCTNVHTCCSNVHIVSQRTMYQSTWCTDTHCTDIQSVPIHTLYQSVLVYT